MLTRVLMVSPEYFNIEYAINPFMVNESGKLKTVDQVHAHSQWLALKDTYEKLGLQVRVLPGQSGLPDMVFAANQSFPFLNSHTGKIEVLLSRMRSGFRQPEVRFFESFYQSVGITTHVIENPRLFFEGNGDALIHPGNGRVLGGWGPRTDQEVYEELSRRFSLQVVRLQLVHPSFYHLDTALCILSETQAIVQKEAFSEESLCQIQSLFEKIYWCDLKDNLKFFVANAHSPKPGAVIMQKGSRLAADLDHDGFQVLEVETAEFMKSGGSVFCMKMMY